MVQLAVTAHSPSRRLSRAFDQGDQIGHRPKVICHQRTQPGASPSHLFRSFRLLHEAGGLEPLRTPTAARFIATPAAFSCAGLSAPRFGGFSDRSIISSKIRMYVRVHVVWGLLSLRFTRFSLLRCLFGGIWMAKENARSI